MVYTDGFHLIAESIPELHAFAKSIGLSGYWFNSKIKTGSRSFKPFYYMITSRDTNDRTPISAIAVEKGALRVSTRKIVEILRLSYGFPESESEIEAFEKRHGYGLTRVPQPTRRKALEMLTQIYNKINYRNR